MPFMLLSLSFYNDNFRNHVTEIDKTKHFCYRVGMWKTVNVRDLNHDGFENGLV